jgi:hypothetical protein
VELTHIELRFIHSEYNNRLNIHVRIVGIFLFIFLKDFFPLYSSKKNLYRANQYSCSLFFLYVISSTYNIELLLLGGIVEREKNSRELEATLIGSVNMEKAQ